MTLPPITPAQAIQLASVAQSVGSVAASAFSDLLGGAAKLLAGDGKNAKVQPALIASGSDGTDVVRNQLQSLLSRFHSELKTLLAGEGRSLPNAATLRLDDGRVASDGGLPVELLESSNSLMKLLRGIFARKQLLDSAENGHAPVSMPSLRISPGSAGFVE